MDLTFLPASKKKEIKEIYEHTIDAFSDSPDFKWTHEAILHEIDEGWELYSVRLEEEIIAALFVKSDEEGFHTKNTAIKMVHQGSGYSHEIKRFFEEEATHRGHKKIFHYCSIDNFRTYSLNESHKYTKQKNASAEDPQVVVWEKSIA